MGEPAAFGSRSVNGTCQYILKKNERMTGDSEKCGAPEYRRSFCQAHFEDCYILVKPKDLTVLADLSSPPWGKIGRATKW